MAKSYLKNFLEIFLWGRVSVFLVFMCVALSGLQYSGEGFIVIVDRGHSSD